MVSFESFLQLEELLLDDVELFEVLNRVFFFDGRCYVCCVDSARGFFGDQSAVSSMRKPVLCLRSC